MQRVLEIEGGGSKGCFSFFRLFESGKPRRRGDVCALQNWAGGRRRGLRTEAVPKREGFSLHVEAV